MHVDTLRIFETAVEQSPASVVITDTNGNIQYVNPKFERLTGYSKSEVIGQNPRVLKSGEKSAEEYRDMWEHITSGREWHGEFHNKKKNGDLYWEYASISPVLDEQQHVMYFLAVKEDITAQKELEFALRRALDTVEKQRNEMLENQVHARLSQRRLMPPARKAVEGGVVHSRYEPAEHIGGDYIDVVSLPDACTGVLIADVSGHGVSAALVSFLLASEFRHALAESQDPATVLASVNDAIRDSVPDDRFASAFVAVLDSRRGVLTYSSAGHPEALLISGPSAPVRQLGTDGFLLGLLPASEAGFETKEMDVNPGDRLLLYSDAFSEVAKKSGQQLGVAGLAQTLQELMDCGPEERLEALRNRVLDWAGQKGFDDDATLLMLDIGA